MNQSARVLDVYHGAAVSTTRNATLTTLDTVPLVLVVFKKVRYPTMYIAMYTLIVREQRGLTLHCCIKFFKVNFDSQGSLFSETA